MIDAPNWNGRKIAKEEDKHDLESRAAVFEFKHRMARPDAEHRAHHEYKQDKHREAAAYHLQGLKAAQASGSQEEGQKHGMLYQLHMKELGLDPMGPVPHEIQGLADKQEKFYRFKAHRADGFLLQDKPEKEEKKSELAKADGKVLPMRPNPTKPDQAAPAKPATVTPIAPKQEARRQLARTKVQGILEDAMHIMGSDPGFQEAARQRETEAKKAKLKAGGQLFKPGQTVSHVDQEAVPWKGKVTSAAYREDDIDGPGHYYEVKWWNPKLNQYHEDYLHQDNLKPG
jgi:hypothetical protein